MGNETDYSDVYSKYHSAHLASNVLNLFGAAVGIIGNTIIIVFYHFRIKDKTERYFIPILAGVDFLACIINAYGNTVLNIYMFDFTGKYHCQFIWFLELFISGFSGHMILIIALQRYLLICKPFGPHMTLKRKRMAVLAISLATTLYASPSWAMSGIKSENRVFRSRNITTNMCVFVVDYTSSAIAYSGLLLLLTVANAGVCIALYLPIIRVIHRSISTNKGCSSIVPFCGTFEDSGMENENSLSSNYHGKHAIFMGDILKELQTDDLGCTLGISRTDLISLDDETCDRGIQNELAEHATDEIFNSENTLSSEKETVSDVAATIHSNSVDRKNGNDIDTSCTYSNYIEFPKMSLSLDCESHNGVENSASLHATTENSVQPNIDVGEMDTATGINDISFVSFNGTRDKSLENLNSATKDETRKKENTGTPTTTAYRNTTKSKSGIRLFRTSSKLERMKATMNIMFMTIIMIYVISYIPSLVILILRYSKADFDYLDFSESEYFVWFFFSRFVFINHIINPIIYGYFDVKLKTEFVRCIRRCLRKKALYI